MLYFKNLQNILYIFFKSIYFKVELHSELVLNYMASMDLVIPSFKLFQVWEVQSKKCLCILNYFSYSTVAVATLVVGHDADIQPSQSPQLIFATGPCQEVPITSAKRYALLGSRSKGREIKDIFESYVRGRLNNIYIYIYIIAHAKLKYI